MAIEYHNYTAKDVRAWLYEGVENGLSERVIAKVRANAILQNPYLEEDTLVAVAAKDGDRVVGFTAMFPDRLTRPDVTLSVATTLWADPDYSGDFISMYLTKALLDNPLGNLVGTDAAPASVLVDKLLGLKATMYSKRRYELNRVIRVRTFRNIGSLVLEPFRQYRRSARVKRMLTMLPKEWRVEYMDFVDKEEYDFILAHNDGDMLCRTQDMLNWVIRNPFRVLAPLASQLSSVHPFNSYSEHFATHLVKCRVGDDLVGLYMFAERGQNDVVLLLYTDDVHREQVYASLLQHILLSKPNNLWSQYPQLNEFIDRVGIAFHGYDVRYSFTRPKDLPVDEKKQLQGLDGDMFV